MGDDNQTKAAQAQGAAATGDRRESKHTARGAILARRARFVAAALASAGLAGAGYACTCLSVVRQPDEPPTVDTGPATGDAAAPHETEEPIDAGAAEQGDAMPPEDAPPARPCLQPPRPQICLSDDPIEGELIQPGQRPEICLEAPF